MKQYWMNSHKVFGIQLATIQKQGYCFEGKTLHALLDQWRMRFERIEADDVSIEAMAVAEKDASHRREDHQTSSSFTTRTAAEALTSAEADQAAASVSTPFSPSNTVSWAVLEEEHMQSQKLKQCWDGP